MTKDVQHCPHKKDPNGFGHLVPRDKMSYVIDARGYKRKCCVDCRAEIMAGRAEAKQRRNK